MNKKLVISLVLIGALAFSLGLGSYAWFSSEAVSENNVFASGTLELEVNGEKDGDYTINFGDVSNLAPGDSTGVAEIKIKNVGSINIGMFRKFTCDDSEELAKQLEVVNYTVNDWATEGTLDLTTHEHWLTDRWDLNGDGYVTLYELANKPYDFGGGWAILGLMPGEEQTVTLGLKLREEAGNEVQGLTVNLGMQIYATQTKADAIKDTMEGKGLTATYAEIESELARQFSSTKH